MMRSLFSGVSGLKNHQTRMDVIGNNISNVNTTGFKSSRVTFADTLNQTMTGAAAPNGTIGGTNPKQVGLGSAVSSIDLLFTDGSVQSTGKNTDLCLSGNGLFVVSNGNQTYYTRNGAFEFDAVGNYTMPGSGLLVQGWTGKDGVINTADAVGNIVVPAGKSMAAKATNMGTYNNNLNSAALTIASISGADTTVTTTLTTSTASTANPITITIDGEDYEVTSGMTLYSSYTYTVEIDDSDLTKAIVTVTDPSSGQTDTSNLTLPHAAPAAVPAGTALTYTGGETTTNTTTTTTPATTATATTDKPLTLTMSDGSTIVQTSGTYSVGYSLPVTTTLTIYDSLGNVHNLPVYFTKTKVSSETGNQWTVSLNTDITNNTVNLSESDGTTTKVEMDAVTIQFTTEGKYKDGSGTAELTLTNGANQTQKVTLNLSSLTQFAGNNTVNGSTDGNAAGTLESVAIDASGVITGTYTNGVKQSEAQVAVAQFTNASGLTKTGSSLYQESNNSGTPNVKTAADLGVKITASALEMSNVDIANEFADMIITQRGFQSNSKIITVGDEMLETVINMKR